MKTIGIAAHSAEGGALCFITACREGAVTLGPHMHPNIAVSAIPMGLSLPSWESGHYPTIAKHLAGGIRMVADAGADFYVCPDNTAHIVLDQIAPDMPIPGLHIADVVCHEIRAKGWNRVGLLGTKWTMTGPVYASKLDSFGLERMIPDPETRDRLNAVIFDELCQGVFSETSTGLFLDAIDELKRRGAECVVLGCTEIPLVVTPENAPLPPLDSTRLLARYAVSEAVTDDPLVVRSGWIRVAG